MTIRADASEISHQPNAPANWTTPAGDVDDKLNELASRAPSALTAWTDNAVLRGDGTSGVQGSTVTIKDTGDLGVAGGISLNDLAAHEALMAPVGLNPANLTDVTAFVNRTVYALWLGQARYSFTTAKFIANVTTAYVAAGVSPHAQVGLASGSFTAGAAPTLTSRGTADVSAVYNAIGRYTTSVTVSGITAGMDLWAIYGFRTTSTLPVLRGMLADDIQSGVFATAGLNIPSSLSATLMTIAGATIVPAWIGLATRG